MKPDDLQLLYELLKEFRKTEKPGIWLEDSIQHVMQAIEVDPRFSRRET